jgi:hypothetical protein
MSADAPAWLALLAPLPDDAMIERKPVASAEQLASGTASAIAGWESITLNLSDPPLGLRHVLLTLDADGTLISGGDGVLFHRTEQRGGELWNIYDHENVGGRFEPDGSFHGTRWHTHTEHVGDEEEPKISSSTPSQPSDDDAVRLRALAEWVLSRAPRRIR